jgi:hypothetical protein
MKPFQVDLQNLQNIDKKFEGDLKKLSSSGKSEKHCVTVHLNQNSETLASR